MPTTSPMPARLYDGDTFTLVGETYRVTFPRDDDHEAPWDDGDGRGIVSAWRPRASKRPHERILSADSYGGSVRFYDNSASLAKALKEGWDAPPYGTGTKRERAARAVEADFQHMRAWCADEWQYVGVVVERLEDGKVTGDRESLWGVESSDEDYLTATAYELAAEITPTKVCECCKGKGRTR